MDDLVDHSISYRIALGPSAGRKALTLRKMTFITGKKSASQMW
jgi:hypothetical protein